MKEPFTKYEALSVLSAILEGKQYNHIRNSSVPIVLIKDVIAILNDVSERDTFAIGFAEWVGSEGYKRMSDNRTTWWGREWLEHQTTSELLDLFKQSLNR